MDFHICPVKLCICSTFIFLPDWYKKIAEQQVFSSQPCSSLKSSCSSRYNHEQNKMEAVSKREMVVWKVLYHLSPCNVFNILLKNKQSRKWTLFCIITLELSHLQPKQAVESQRLTAYWFCKRLHITSESTNDSFCYQHTSLSNKVGNKTLFTFQLNVFCASDHFWLTSSSPDVYKLDTKCLRSTGSHFNITTFFLSQGNCWVTYTHPSEKKNNGAHRALWIFRVLQWYFFWHSW